MSSEREPRLLRTFHGGNAPEVRPVDWLISQFLARGAGTLIFGQPGVSKTVHAAYLAACLVSGRPFAHLTTVTRGLRVLYMDSDGSWEWNRDLFLAAFRGVGIEGIPEAFVYYSPNTPECIWPDEELTLHNLESLGQDLARTVREQQIDVVICDSLGQMMIGDMNSGQDVSLALRLGLNPARKAGAAVLVIDHATKSAAGGVGIPTPMGSQQKRAWARVSVALEKEEDGITRWSVDKSNTAPFAPFLTRTTFISHGERVVKIEVEFVGEAGPRLGKVEQPDRAQQKKVEILDALQEGSLTRSRLGKGGTFDRAIQELERDGQVVKLARGLYALPESQATTPPQTLGDGVVVGGPRAPDDDVEERTW